MKIYLFTEQELLFLRTVSTCPLVLIASLSNEGYNECVHEDRLAFASMLATPK